MTFEIEIDTSNDAFQPDPAPELADMLTLFAQRINENGISVGDKIALTDVNGNKVGIASLG